MTYSCECCAYKCLYPKDLEKHNLTNKHQKNMTKKEIKCDGCLQKDVMIERLQQENNELRSKYDSLVDKIVLQSFQPAGQTPVQCKQVQSAVKKRERYNEEYLNANYTTTIDEFLEQVNFDEEEVGDLFETSGAVEDLREIVDKLVLKKLKETVDSTDICDRGFVTTDLDRKKMWIKKTKWEVDKEATFVIKKNLWYKILDVDIEISSERKAEINAELCYFISNSNKWENIDTKIMQMFVVDS